MARQDCIVSRWGIVSAVLLVILCGCVRSRKGGTQLYVDIDKCLSEEVSFVDLFLDMEVIPLDSRSLLPFGQYSEPQMWAIGDDGLYFLTDRGVIKHYDHSGSFVAEYDKHSLFYDIDTGEARFFRSFKKGYRFKASKVWNGCLYLVVESEYLEEFGVEEPVNSNTCIIKYTLKQ